MTASTAREGGHAASQAAARISLPPDHPRPPVPSFVKTSITESIDPARLAAIRELCGRSKVPEAAVWSAGLATVLARHAQLDAFTLGIWCPRGESGALMCHPVRVQVAEEPAETLVQRLAGELDNPGGPPTAFGAAVVVGAWSGELATVPEGYLLVETELAFGIDPDRGTLRGECERDLFESATMRRLIGEWLVALDGFINAPALPVTQLPLLTEEERQRYLVEWNGRATLPRRGCLHHRFEGQVAQTPGAPAVVCGETSLTYAELNSRANRLAHRLRELGVGPETIVGLCLDRSIDLVVAILGILKAGGAYLPIDSTYPPDRVAFMLEDAQVPAVVTQTALQPLVGTPKAHVVLIDAPSEVLARQPMEDPEGPVGPDNLAYVIYTSGSTGKPKGVMVTHYHVTRLFDATDAWFGFGASDVWTLFHSAAFDFSVWEIWGALLYGGRLVVVPYQVSRSPDDFYKLLVRERVTVLNQTPSAFRQLMAVDQRVDEPGILPLRYVIFGGEALDLQSLSAWFSKHGDERPRLVNMYGITETTVHVTYRPISSEDIQRRMGSLIGQPIPDLRLHVLDAHRQLVPVGVPGELYVGGAGVARGYLSRPELTAERFIADPFSAEPGARLYRSGDLARRLPDGDLEYLGRIDHQVKIRGFRIELGEIEAALRAQPGVRDVAVVAREDAPGDRRLVAYIVPTGDASSLITEARDRLRAILPDYMVPSAFVTLAALPLTENAKVDRRALPAPDPAAGPERRATFTPPRTPAERALADVWARVLGVARVGVQDNFFELGGDSILAIRVVVGARQAGWRISPSALFTNSTVAHLAAVATPITTAPTAPPSAAQDIALTPIQCWFLEQDFADPHHWNQAFLFETLQPLDATALERALTAVVNHHDALRLRLTREDRAWRARYEGRVDRVPIASVDVSGLAPAASAATIEGACADLQVGLDLARGPLLRAARFDCGPDRPGRLLLVIHHLAVDAVSWRILLEDLETAYLQIRAGRDLALPPQTTSIHQWATRLSAYARSDAAVGDVDYWTAMGSDGGRPSYEGNSSANSEGEAVTIAVRLDQERTRALLQRVPAAYHTQINDVLLAALARACAAVGGETSSPMDANSSSPQGGGLCSADTRSFHIDLEGHGREDLFDDVDLSRTVGWFTTIFPVRLEVDASESPGASLISVKEQLRRVPGKGLPYSALRFLGPPDLRTQLQAQPRPDLLFNYLGQFDRLTDASSLFRLARESTGPWRSPRAQRTHATEILALVLDGCFEARWTYSPALHEPPTVERQARRFLRELEALIDHCDRAPIGAHTPSDFPLARVDQPALDRWRARYGELDDLYPLSPMQGLFFSLEQAEGAPGFEQWQFDIRGRVDSTRLRHAWEAMLSRHSILRTVFVSEGRSEPLQLVLKTATLDWTELDWRDMSRADQDARLATWLGVDRERGLDIQQLPPMRLAFIRTADDAGWLVWSTHHLCIDGWSWPVVLRDLAALYVAAEGDGPLALKPACPYRAYIARLQRAPRVDAEAFWQERLKGFSRPTPLPRRAVAATFPPGSPAVEEISTLVARDATADLKSLARRYGVTLNTLVQGAWALVLTHQSGDLDVVFGAAFAGRPADVPGIETMVGSCVTNLPIRVVTTPDASLAEWLAAVQEAQVGLGEQLGVTPLEIQGWAQIPWRHRLFESLLVFQNYTVDESTRRLGPGITIEPVLVPETTNYPMTVVVYPGDTLRVKFLSRPGHFARDVVERMAVDYGTAFDALRRSRTPREVLGALPAATRGAAGHLADGVGAHARATTPTRPRSDLEGVIAGIWTDLLGVEDIDVEQGFFDLGGYSLLLVEAHRRLRTALARDFPVVTLLQYPTIRALARHLTGEMADERSHAIQHRARLQREAMARRPGPPPTRT